MWQIIVIMLVTFGAELDAIEISHNNGKPLEFESQAICYAHVEANLEKLKSYASSQFDGAPVKSIICVKKPFGVNNV